MKKNKDWLLSIPKICHIYWGGGPLLYLRYLTVKTFMKFNPDWQVILWYPMYSFTGKSWGIEHNYLPLNTKLCKDYLPELMESSVTKMPVDFKELGFRDNTPEVHKADYMRIYTLFLYGGIWTDLDILFFKPLTELKVNIPENKDKATYVCISPSYGHSTGFNMALEDSRFFGELKDRLNKNYDPNVYQCWGPNLFNDYSRDIKKIPEAVEIGMEAVYAHDCFSVLELQKKVTPRFSDNSIGCHWYAGHSMWGKFFNETKGGVENLPNNIIGNLIKDAK
jgi:hypothetical protein